ncbi:MAG: hydroxyacid dehydrogenase [Spirochaetes bacterium]|nr:hydroxyacid dehydrogenase [Spirochaetota bacterium]
MAKKKTAGKKTAGKKSGAKPRIAVLLSRGSESRVMCPDAWARLRKGFEVATETPESWTPDAAKRVLAGADGVITGWGTPALTADLLEAAPKLRILAHSAGSVKPVVSEAIWKRKVIVTSAASCLAYPVAEMALGCLIFGLRGILTSAAATQRDGGWNNNHPGTNSIYRRTIGVVGAGFVGRLVLGHLQRFEAEVLVHDPFLSEVDARKLGARKAGLDEIAQRADAVTLHAPDIDATAGMINAAFLGALKPGCIFVNTARGRLVDEAALIARLQKGDLFAFLDVTHPEPPAADNPLRRMANVVLTPHIAGAGQYLRNGFQAISELERAFSGKKPKYGVTEAMLAKMA